MTPRTRLGKFYWKEGVFASEIEEALKPGYGARYPWLFTRRTQRMLVALNVVAWIGSVFGASPELSWNLGFGGSAWSWWCLLVLISWLLVRQSVRSVADAPEELIDERLVALRDSAYLSAYRIIGFIIAMGLGVLWGILQDSSGATALDPSLDDMVLVIYLVAFIHASLPSMVLAWKGDLT